MHSLALMLSVNAIYLIKIFYATNRRFFSLYSCVYLSKKSDNIDRRTTINIEMQPEDMKVVEILNKYMMDCPHIFKDHKKVKTFLKDMISDRILEINLLMALVELGILSELQVIKRDEMIMNKYVMMLNKYYANIDKAVEMGWLIN